MNQSNLLTVRVAGVMNRQAVVLHAGRTLPCLLSGRLLRQKDSLAVGDRAEAEVLGDGDVLTLKAFTDRGKATPPTATVYRTVEINGYRCTVCGYVYEGESLPPDFRCPLCHAPAEKFVKIEK